MTIHGVTQKVTTTGLIEVKADGIVVTAEFPVKVTDYGVKIPAATKDNVAETVTTRVRAELKPMEPTN
jgi:polyisoprenoid-binding protein YceI